MLAREHVVTYRQFVTSGHDEFLTTLGIEAVPSENEEFFTLTSTTAERETVTVTVDTAGRSIGCHVDRDGRSLVRLEREGATLLRPRFAGGEAFVDVDFETDELHGRLTIQLHPHFEMKDTLLLH